MKATMNSPQHAVLVVKPPGMKHVGEPSRRRAPFTTSTWRAASAPLRVAVTVNRVPFLNVPWTFLNRARPVLEAVAVAGLQPFEHVSRTDAPGLVLTENEKTRMPLEYGL